VKPDGDGEPQVPEVTLTLSEAFRQAVAAYERGQLLEAERLCRAILDADTGHFDATRLLGTVQYRGGRHAEALASYDAALALTPDHAETHSNRGSALKELRRHAEALASYDRALAIAPGFAEAHYNRGGVLKDLKQFGEALASYDRALAIRPRHPDTLNNRGNVLKEMGRIEDALASYDAALALRPTFAEALNNRGGALQALKRPDEALASYDRALAIAPGYADALHNRGVMLKEMRRFADALACLDAMLAIRPNDPDALANRGSLLMELGRPAEALASYERALAIAPDHAIAFGGVADCAIKLCDWERLVGLSGDVRRRIAAGEPLMFPLVMLGFADEPALHLACARSFIRSQIPALPQPLWRGETWQNERIRLAYLSADFHQHPVAQLMVELLEGHDRTRFEVIGISTAPDDGSALRARLIRAFDRFHDVRETAAPDIARLMHDMRADIVVDLTGYTQGGRPEILALRPAPIQVSYLGYPGTLGADFIDYIIADPIILPFDQESFYAEKIVHLPDTYQANESRRANAGAAPSRREAGLPDEGFVFCCFNNHLKITAPVFEVWMRLLGAVDASVLWLSAFNGVGVANLTRAAAAHGIDPGRVIFAPRTEHFEDHLARLRLVDLFLDTLPYNAHTTASDALWAGVPVLTCRGNGFAGRVAASLLHGIGLPELVTTSLADYEALALRLATDPALLAGLRARLERNRPRFPLFDGERFRRHIEAAYITMWQTWQRGEPPRSFAVEPLQPSG